MSSTHKFPACFWTCCIISIYFPLNVVHSFIPLACAECDDSLPFSGASSISLCYVLFPAILLHQLFFHPLLPHLAVYFLVYVSILLFPNSYIIPFWEFCFLSTELRVTEECYKTFCTVVLSLDKSCRRIFR